MTPSYKNMWEVIRQSLNKKGVRTALYIGILALSGAFIAFLVYKNWGELSRQEWRFDPFYLVLSLLSFSLGMLPTIAAWHHLLKALGINLPFKTNLRIYSLSAIPRHVPGLVLYFTSRSLLYQDEGVPAGLTVAATTMEIVIVTLTGLVVSIPMFITSVPALSAYPFMLAAAIAAILFLLALLLFTPALKKVFRVVLGKRLGDLPPFQRGSLVFNFIWMFIAWMGMGFTLFFFTHAVVPLDWSLLPTMMGIWGASSAVSVSIGALIQGFGIREVTMGALLSLVISPLAAVVVAVGFRLLFTAAELLWVGIFLLITKPPSKNGRKVD